MVTVVEPPFCGLEEDAPMRKNEGTESMATESAVLLTSVLSIAQPLRSWMSILKLPELSLVLGLKMLSQVIKMGPFVPT